MLVRRSFSLDTERDAALLAWLDQQENASEAVRAALRSHCEDLVSLRDIYQAIRELGNSLNSVCAKGSIPRAMHREVEDPELAANLDFLGL